MSEVHLWCPQMSALLHYLCRSTLDPNVFKKKLCYYYNFLLSYILLLGRRCLVVLHWSSGVAVQMFLSLSHWHLWRAPLLSAAAAPTAPVPVVATAQRRYLTARVSQSPVPLATACHTELDHTRARSPSRMGSSVSSIKAAQRDR